MREVTQAEFFAVINTLNVHPRCVDPAFTDWEMLDGSRRLVGRTFPGWRNPQDPKRYLLVEV